MGKKKRNRKQPPLSGIRENDEVSARAAKAAAHRSTNTANSNAGNSGDTDVREVVYNPEWRRRGQQSGQSKSGQSNRSHCLRGKDSKPTVKVAGSHEEKIGGVMINSIKRVAENTKGDGEVAEMLSGLALDSKSKASRDKITIQGNMGMNGSFSVPRAGPISSSESSKPNKPQAHITAKKGVKSSYIKGQSRIHKTKDPVQQLSVPKPSAAYLAQSSKPSNRLAAPQPLLVILDLNGTLLRRSKQRGSKWVDPRPYVTEFLSETVGVSTAATKSVPIPTSTRNSAMPFSTSATSPVYSVMIWSSARPENVRSMCSKILTAEQKSRLVGIWARDQLRLSSIQYAAKIPVYKQLEWVWASNEIGQAYLNQSDRRNDENTAYKRSDSYVENSISSDGPRRNRYWGQHNTVLLDDSALKARAEPYNVIVLPEFKGLGKELNCECVVDIAGKRKTETCETHECTPVLQQVRRYLEELSYQSDVSSYIRVNPFAVQKHVGNSVRSRNLEKV